MCQEKGNMQLILLHSEKEVVLEIRRQIST